MRNADRASRSHGGESTPKSVTNDVTDPNSDLAAADARLSKEGLSAKRIKDIRFLRQVHRAMQLIKSEGDLGDSQDTAAALGRLAEFVKWSDLAEAEGAPAARERFETVAQKHWKAALRRLARAEPLAAVPSGIIGGPAVHIGYYYHLKRASLEFEEGNFAEGKSQIESVVSRVIRRHERLQIARRQRGTRLAEMLRNAKPAEPRDPSLRLFVDRLTSAKDLPRRKS